MEGGPKKVVEAAKDNEQVETDIDSVESIERAVDIKAEIDNINKKGDVYGTEALSKKAEADALEAEYIAVLSTLSNEVRAKYQLPQRSPLDPQLESKVVQFPSAAQSGYAHTLDYTHAANDDSYPRVGDEQREAA